MSAKTGFNALPMIFISSLMRLGLPGINLWNLILYG